MNEEQKAERAQRLRQAAFNEELTKGIDDTNFVKIIQAASAEFTGDLHVLQAAIGALMMGRLYGWRVLKLILSHRTFKRYQDTLGIQFKEVCPERGVLYEKSIGCKVADATGAFWKVVRGMVKIDCYKPEAS